MSADISKKVKQIISEQLGVELEKIVDGASFSADLKADSLDTVELVMALEEAFQVTVTDEQASKIQTVSDAIELVRALSLKRADGDSGES